MLDPQATCSQTRIPNRIRSYVDSNFSLSSQTLFDTPCKSVKIRRKSLYSNDVTLQMACKTNARTADFALEGFDLYEKSYPSVKSRHKSLAYNRIIIGNGQDKPKSLDLSDSVCMMCSSFTPWRRNA